MCYTINYKIQTNKTAVVLWLYHIEQWDEFVELLLPLSKYIKLYLGLCLENNNSKIIQDSRLHNLEHILTFHDNFGADVAPFLQQLFFVREKYFIKLHSKDSKFGFKKHIDWRKLLLHNLIGSKRIFQDNISLLDNQNIGLITNNRCLLKNQERRNSNQIKELCEILDLDYENLKNGPFAAGNMFISKTILYQNLFYSRMNEVLGLLINEKNKVSDSYHGTYTHALERIFGYIIKHNNLQFDNTRPPYIKIYNTKSENGFYKLIILDNNDCYLEEDINVYGSIVENNINYMTIEWHHTSPNSILQKYKKYTNSSLIQYYE